MGCCNSSPSVPLHAYYNSLGSLVRYEPPQQHHPKEEFDFVQKEDSQRFNPGDDCYLINAQWLADWLSFAMSKASNAKHAPSSINNSVLLDSTGAQVRSDIRSKDDYREVNKKVWEYLFSLYGGGPVIVFKVPPGLSDKEYKKGTWIRRMNLQNAAVVITPSSHPFMNSELFENVINPIREDSVASVNSELAANHMLHDLGKAKMAQAKELQKEINQESANAAAALLNKDLGKKKMEEARQKEEEQNKAEAEAAANIFAGNMAEVKAREAKEAQEAALQAQQAQVADMFGKMGAKMRFREALKVGNMAVAEDAAALMLQNAWRAKKARQRVIEMKKKRQAALEESCARKLQSRYRMRIAKRRVDELRAEKQRLREEGAAIMLQSAWRCRKSRERVQRLKEEKQRLLEEGAALMLQSAWRIKQAKQKVAGLRAERVEKQRRDAAAECIGRLLLVLIARIRVRNHMKKRPQVLLVELKGATGLNIADTSIGSQGSSDPYVIVNTQTGFPDIQENPIAKSASADDGATVTPSKGGTPSRRKSITKSMAADTRTLSLFRSSTKSYTLNPVWNEQCIATNVRSGDAVVLTIFDKDNFNADDTLGQVVLLIRRYQQLYWGKEVSCPMHPIGDYVSPVYDGAGKTLTDESTAMEGQGNITFTFRLSPPALTHAGKVMKQAGSLLGFGGATYKERYMILTPNWIRYFDDEFSLDKPRGNFLCEKVTAITYMQDSKTHEWTLQIKTADDEWSIRWVADEKESGKDVWLRKLQYCCPKIALNGEPGSLVERVESSAKRGDKIGKLGSASGDGSGSKGSANRKKSMFAF